MKKQHLIITSTAAALFGSITLQAAPVVIDYFADTVATTSEPTVQTGPMLGGERQVHGNGQTYQIAGGALTSFAAAQPNNVALEYLDSGGLDLTGGGTNDRLRIEVSALRGSITSIEILLKDVNSSAYHETYSFVNSSAVTGSGVVEFPFADFGSPPVGGADLTLLSSVWIAFHLEAGTSLSVSAIVAGDLDKAGPRLKVIEKKKLLAPRTRHDIVGIARDQSLLDRVEVKAPKQKWRKAKLKPSGSFHHRTPRHAKAVNVYKIRGYDLFGNRSKTLRVKATGKM